MDDMVSIHRGVSSQHQGKGAVWSGIMSNERVLNKGWKGIETCTHSLLCHEILEHFVEKGIYTQTTISTVEHKGLVDWEMQAVSFQQVESWETIFSLSGCRRFWERGKKSVFPSVGLKGKYYLPTAAIISSSAVMTAGLERKNLPLRTPT